MIQVSLDASGLIASVEGIEENLKTLDEVLKPFGRYLRAKASAKFKAQGPGWPAIAGSTQERLEHLRTAKITTAGNLRKSAERQIRKQLKAKVRSGKVSALAIEALNQALYKRKTASPLAAQVRAALIARTPQVQRLAAQLEKHEKKTEKQRRGGKRQAAKHKLLGKLASSLRAKISKHTLTVESRVPWAGVHNVGGEAGHGSRIPKRSFLELDDEDIRIFLTMLEDYIAEGQAAQG